MVQDERRWLSTLVLGTHRAGRPPLQPGTTLGPYRVTAKIGEGSMGEVYRARDTKLDRDVALKALMHDGGSLRDTQAKSLEQAVVRLLI